VPSPGVGYGKKKGRPVHRDRACSQDSLL